MNIELLRKKFEKKSFSKPAKLIFTSVELIETLIIFEDFFDKKTPEILLLDLPELSLDEWIKSFESL